MEMYRIAMTGLMSGAGMAMWSMMMKMVGLSKMDMVAYLGGLLTGKSSGMMSFMMGMLMHFVLSVLVAFVYFFALMNFMNMITWQYGMLLGFVHWVVSGIMLPLVDAINSCVQSKKIPALGYFAQGYGAGAVLTFFIGHLLYGTMIGFILA